MLMTFSNAVIPPMLSSCVGYIETRLILKARIYNHNARAGSRDDRRAPAPDNEEIVLADDMGEDAVVEIDPRPAHDNLGVAKGVNAEVMNNVLGLRAVRGPQAPDHISDVILEDRLPVFKIFSCRGCHDREAALAGNVILRVSDGPIVAARL